MATLLLTEATEGLEAPRRDQEWSDWLGGLARRMRATVPRHRDGARVFAGSAVQDPALRVTAEMVDSVSDEGFEAGLRIVLAGLEAERVRR